jgi:energy-coupling factor transporter ATP-binding protein EcfA2
MSLIRANDVCFAYSGRRPPVFSRLSFTIDSGRTWLLVGDNGSGKTTLGKLMAGMLAPQSGSIRIRGQEISLLSARARSRLAIYVSQVSYLQFFTPTIADEIAFALRCAKAVASPELADAYAAFGLPPQQGVSPLELSYPEMWRLQLYLLGIVFDPTVLFIDEVIAPSAWPQQRALEWMLTRRKENGHTTIIAYQRIISVPADIHLVCLDSGVLYDG